MIVATERGLYAVDSLQAELEHLGQLAAVVLNEHVNEQGWCAVCVGVVFPCDSAVLAEHNLAVM